MLTTGKKLEPQANEVGIGRKYVDVWRGRGRRHAVRCAYDGWRGVHARAAGASRMEEW